MQCHCMKILDRMTKYNVQCLSCHSIALGKGITLVVCLVKASMFYTATTCKTRPAGRRVRSASRFCPAREMFLNYMRTGPRHASTTPTPCIRPKLLIKHRLKTFVSNNVFFLLFRQRSLEPTMIINILDVGVKSHPRAFP